MRQYILPLLIALLVPLAGLAGGVNLNPALRFEFTDCSSTGSALQNVTGGHTYLARVTDNDVFVCYAATCTGTSGERLPSGAVFLLAVPGTSSSTQTMSCRSSTSTGDFILTAGD